MRLALPDSHEKSKKRTRTSCLRGDLCGAAWPVGAFEGGILTKSSALDISKPLEEEKVDDVEPSRRLDVVRERGRVDEPSCTSADMVVVAGWTTKGRRRRRR